MFWENLETWGCVCLIASALIGYALSSQGHHVGALGITTRVLQWALGDLCWLIPSMLGILGVLFILEAGDPRIVAPMTLGASVHVLLFATIFDQGALGVFARQIITAMAGEASTPLIDTFFVMLTIGMAGISLRRSLKAIPKALGWLLRRRREVTKRRRETVVVQAMVSVCNDAIGPRTGGYRLPALSIYRAPLPLEAVVSNYQVKLVSSLKSLGVNVSYQGQDRGPTVTSYRIKPALGTKVSRITALRDDIQIALSAQSVRIEAPIPGMDVVGIEVPNAVRDEVYLRDMLDGLGTLGALPIVIGRDMTGNPVRVDLADMPHMLIAGATGSGKSVFLNVLIASLLSTRTPSELQLLFIDPKRTELSPYNGIPHLGGTPAIVDLHQAAAALQKVKREMESRFQMLSRARVRKISEYNAKHPDSTIPYLVVVIDEMAELILTVGAEVEKTIISISQLGRAAGVHLILATQKPLVTVVTSLIKSNMPCRVAFAVASQVDSRTILDMNGAETLLGRGDMLFLPEDASKPRRIQAANVTGSELEALIEHWKTQPALSTQELLTMPQETTVDPRAYEAALFMIETKRVSTIGLRKHLGVGHPRAVEIMDQLAELGVVSGHVGSKSRQLLITSQESLDQIFGREHTVSS